MVLIFIIASVILLYAFISLATFEKFISNGLVPKRPFLAALLTPVMIVMFYLKVTIKAFKFSPKSALKYLTLASIKYPVGIGLYIELNIVAASIQTTANVQEPLRTKEVRIEHPLSNEELYNEIPLTNMWSGMLANC